VCGATIVNGYCIEKTHTNSSEPAVEELWGFFPLGRPVVLIQSHYCCWMLSNIFISPPSHHLRPHINDKELLKVTVKPKLTFHVIFNPNNFPSLLQHLFSDDEGGATCHSHETHQ